MVTLQPFHRKGVIALTALVVIGICLHLAFMFDWLGPISAVYSPVLSMGREYACGPVSEQYGENQETDKKRYAYVQYATNVDYLCNALMNLDRLETYGVRHEKVIMYPEAWDTQNTSSHTKLLTAAAVNYSATLIPVPLITTPRGDRTWRYSLTKLNIFRLERYSRVLYFDSDTLVSGNMDWLFDAPPARIALPRAYWLEPKANDSAPVTLGSHVMLVEPDFRTYGAILRKVAEEPDFDMEIVNRMFGSTAMVLPHRHLALLTGEFREQDHSRYLGEIDSSDWDPEKEVRDSYLIHFSDWPLPKPWLPRTEQAWASALPSCPDISRSRDGSETTDFDCPDRKVWTSLYADYDSDRARVCQAL